jgi:glucosamine--fructose-6-phosphate aminotransferase (isomerizing)
VKLKEKLIKEGHQFHSQCDTEVISHLIEKYFQEKKMGMIRNKNPSIAGSMSLSQ